MLFDEMVSQRDFWKERHDEQLNRIQEVEAELAITKLVLLRTAEDLQAAIAEREEWEKQIQELEADKKILVKVRNLIGRLKYLDAARRDTLDRLYGMVGQPGEYKDLTLGVIEYMSEALVEEE